MDGGIIPLDGVCFPVAEELGAAAGEQARQGLLQGGGGRVPAHAAHVHTGDAGVGQQGAAARGGAQPGISGPQGQNHNQQDDQSEFLPAPLLLGRALRHTPARLLFHINQLQLCEKFITEFHYRSFIRKKQLQNGYIRARRGPDAFAGKTGGNRFTPGQIRSMIKRPGI